MLQFYDRKGIGLTLAFAALAGHVSATEASSVSCHLEDGYAVEASLFADEVEMCLKTHAAALREDIQADVTALTERHRAKLNLDPLSTRQALTQAAQAHAMDMAMRGYADHLDLEGRDHLDRIRTLDRAVLIGAAGANIAVANFEDGATAFNALIQDEENANNLSRSAFTHSAVGAAQDKNGRVYVVQLFAQIDGELTTPMPTELPAIADLKAQFSQNAFTPVGWELRDLDGQLLSRGFGEQIRYKLRSDEVADLTIEVALHPGVNYALKGPRVTGH